MHEHFFRKQIPTKRFSPFVEFCRRRVSSKRGPKNLRRLQFLSHRTANFLRMLSTVRMSFAGKLPMARPQRRRNRCTHFPPALRGGRRADARASAALIFSMDRAQRFSQRKRGGGDIPCIRFWSCTHASKRASSTRRLASRSSAGGDVRCETTHSYSRGSLAMAKDL